MEPKITCLDSATWLANSNPQDVVVGAVISFTPTADCDLSSSRVAHRVISIKVEAGIYYYWPRGDANSSDNGCWIPDTNVNGYIIELHKNTNPENEELREKVNSAIADRYAALQAYKRKERTYDRKLDNYNEKYVEYCGSSAPDCTLSEPFYSELKELYDELVSLEAKLESLYDAYEDAYNAWEQAYNEVIG